MESLSFSERARIVASAAVTPDRQLGYSFTPRPGSQLSYQTNNEKICIWLYDAALKLMNAGQIQSTNLQNFDLTEDLQYTLQVSSLAGRQEFDLDMLLLMPLTEKEALQLINKWLAAKKKIFAPPYDKDLAAKLTAGDRYEKVMGSIEWLQDNKSEWQYISQSTEPTGKFWSSLKEATIEVIVSENRALYINGKLDSNQTTFGSDISLDKFELVRDKNIWKIVNYEPLD